MKIGTQQGCRTRMLGGAPSGTGEAPVLPEGERAGAGGALVLPEGERGGTGGAPVLPERERGVALLIVLFMVSFLFVFVIANSNALFGLKREIKLIDQKQKARWSEISTNRVVGAGRPAVCDTADGAVCVTIVTASVAVVELEGR